MKKTGTFILALVLAAATTQAQQKQISSQAKLKPVSLKSLKQIPIEPSTQQMSVKPSIKKPVRPRTTAIDVVPLGTSLNPYGLIGGSRPAIASNPATNSVAFIRRGGPENGGADFGSRYYYDLSTNGGSTFTLARGILYNPNVRPGNPALGRYPQGVIYNPPGNTNPSNAYAIATGAVLDGSNASGTATWGGFGYGIHKMDNSAPGVFKLQTSTDRFKYLISNSIAVLPNAKAISVEENLPDGGNATAVDDSMIVTTLNITTSPLNITASPTKIAFPSFEGNISRPKIAFAPDGLVGYIAAVGAPIDNSEPKRVYVPMYSKTTDGGLTWSAAMSVPLNSETLADPLFVDCSFSGVKQSILGGDGDFIEFTDQPGLQFRAFFSTTFEFDITVDAAGNLHFLAPFMVAGWEDTDREPDFSVYPGIGGVMVDVYMRGNNWKFRPLKLLNFWRGCVGDCPGGANRIAEANRPGASRNADGTKLFFGWFDSDTLLVGEPANTSDVNNFPDFYVSGYDVISDNWAPARDLTGPSPAYGTLFLGNFASTVLTAANGNFLMPVTFAATTDEVLPDGSNLATLTTENYYLSGLEVAANAFTEANDADTCITANRWTNLEKVGLEVSVFPNPVENKAYVVPMGNVGSTVKVTLVNSMGQVVKVTTVTDRKPAQHIEVDTKDLKAGIYNCIVETKGKSKISKFVKE